MGTERIALKAIYEPPATACLIFSKIRFIHLLRNHNQMADALTFLASVWEGPVKMPMKPLILLQSEQPSYKYLKMVEPKADNKPWFYDIQ